MQVFLLAVPCPSAKQECRVSLRQARQSTWYGLELNNFQPCEGRMEEQFITAAVLSERLGVPKSSVYRMAAKGLLPWVPWGVERTGRRFIEHEVRAALAQLQARPSGHDQAEGKGNGKK